LRKEAIDVGAERGERDCFSPCSWWMRLASQGRPGLEKMSWKRKSQNGLLAEFPSCPRIPMCRKGRGHQTSWGLRIGQAPDSDSAGQQKKALGSYGGSTSGNSETSTGFNVSSRNGKKYWMRESAARMGKGLEGTRRGRRSTAIVAWGFLLIGNVNAGDD